MEYLSDQSLILMPGLDGTGLSFEPFLKFISANANVTVVCYPTDKLLSFAETVECAAAQVSSLSRPVVIAESFSGPVAVQMIASGLVRAKALVLCATFAKSPHPFLWPVIRFLRIPLLIGPEMPALFFKIILGDEKRIASLVPLWKKVHADVPARVMDHRLGLINLVDVTQSLKKLSLPCLYLQAIDDRIVLSSSLTDFERSIPQLMVKRIKAPHFILQDKPQECLEAIEEFLVSMNQKNKKG
jgi:pimeloyl-[acyl-carrier protein] methyl ester esterase